MRHIFPLSRGVRRMEGKRRNWLLYINWTIQWHKVSHITVQGWQEKVVGETGSAFLHTGNLWRSYGELLWCLKRQNHWIQFIFFHDWWPGGFFSLDCGNGLSRPTVGGGSGKARLARAYGAVMKVYLCQLSLIKKDIAWVKFHFAACRCSSAAPKKIELWIHSHTHTARLVLRECCTKNQGEHRCSFFKSVVLSSNGTESTWVLRETGNVWDKFSDTGFYRMTCDLSLVHMKYDWRRVCRLNISK